MKLHDTTAMSHPFQNNVTDGHEPILQGFHASRRVIGLNTQLLSIKRPDWLNSSHAPELWRHDWDISNQNMVLLLVFHWKFQGWLVMLREENLTSKCNVDMMKSPLNCTFTQNRMR